MFLQTIPLSNTPFRVEIQRSFCALNLQCTVRMGAAPNFDTGAGRAAILTAVKNALNFQVTISRANTGGSDYMAQVVPLDQLIEAHALLGSHIEVVQGGGHANDVHVNAIIHLNVGSAVFADKQTFIVFEGRTGNTANSQIDVYGIGAPQSGYNYLRLQTNSCVANQPLNILLENSIGAVIDANLLSRFKASGNSDDLELDDIDIRALDTMRTDTAWRVAGVSMPMQRFVYLNAERFNRADVTMSADSFVYLFQQF